MASSGFGGAQYRRRDGPSGGKGKATFNKQARKQGEDGGGSQAGKRRAEPGVVSVHSKSGQIPGSGKAKRRWRPSQQVYAGSAKEGKGFALWRKQKVQLEYKKLQRKQKKTTTAKDLYVDSYPEHLKHLYLAEEERLKNLEKKRKPEEDPTQTIEGEKEEEVVVPKKKFKKKTSNQKAKEEYEQVRHERAKKRKLDCLRASRCHKVAGRELLGCDRPCKDGLPKKKFKKKTSNQKAKEEYEQVRHERAKKRKEAEENRRKGEEARELYKKKKMEAYKVLNTKTKKGQPNFNVQMEYLLKKIQSKT
ncbi:PREDICTED: thyroid transcription factor 1-associated protein 26 [Nanorana parkeri]|uniref:thyroid transcription factor 1-associated protein 26 n=1 Tax=Nanorana parkeri TaxID=125878 RepID=UPI0008540F8E|nr:PREDICTED: thyroid transcription factor 1-associated protein 26 [Nanorana parkeri]